MNIVVIDDEKNVRQGLVRMLETFCTEVEVIGEANGVQSGLALLRQNPPDLVFLDIEMPDGSGLDLLKRLDSREFQVIFVTAYDEYAVEAFRLSAVDYLLKPVNPDQLIEAVEKAREWSERHHFQLELSILMENMNLLSQQERKIVLKDADSLYIVKIKDILHCQADGGYTEFYLEGGRKIVTSVNLKEYEKLFSPCGFLRSHHSHLVNLQHIVRFDKVDGGQLVLSDETIVPVSLRKKEALLKSLQNMSNRLWG